jgi:HEAT repeat protein
MACKNPAIKGGAPEPGTPVVLRRQRRASFWLGIVASGVFGTAGLALAFHWPFPGGGHPSTTLAHEVIERGLDSNNEVIKGFALQAVSEAHLSDLDPKVRALTEHTNPCVRIDALKTLAADGDTAVMPALQAELARASGSKSVFWRRESVEAMGDVGGPKASAILHARLKDPDPYVRLIAAGSLLKQGDRDHLPAVLASLSNDAHHLRMEALYALYQGDAREQAPRVRRMLLEDEEFDVRLVAAGVLGKWGDGEAIGELEARRERSAAAAEYTCSDECTALLVLMGDKRAVREADRLMRTAPLHIQLTAAWGVLAHADEKG